MNLNSILMGSDDPDRLVAYYTKLFGEPSFNDGGYVGWALGTGSIAIGAHSEVHGQNAHPGRIIWNLETTDVKSDYEKLVAAGATVVTGPYNFAEGGVDAWVATLSDPDGNYFQLVSPMA